MMSTSNVQPASASTLSEMCDLAYSLADASNYADAAQVLRDAIALAPSHYLAHFRLGVVLADAGRLDEALNAYNDAVAIDQHAVQAHNNRGAVLQRLGRNDEAQVAFELALRLAPGLAPPYVNLANVLQAQERMQDAIGVYERAIALGLEPELFGQYVSALRGGTANARSPDSWVRATFDNFAPSFDAQLRNLGYDVPAVMARELAPYLPPHAVVLDLGCGTGLLAEAMPPAMAARFIGVDLSPRMLALARARGHYAELHEAEIHSWLAACPPASLDAVVAADVFIYIGDLGAVFADVYRILVPGGLFAFSVEADDRQDYVLRETGRYAQSEHYISRLLDGGWSIRLRRSTTIRTERGTPVAGGLYIAQRLGAPGR